jgi:hypothetical protein
MPIDEPTLDDGRTIRITPPTKATMKPAKAPSDPDYRAAWLACREPDETWGQHHEPTDLRAKLDEALRGGWTPQALKAYAFVCWRYTKPKQGPRHARCVADGC